MSDKSRIIVLQKQLRIASKALRLIFEEGSGRSCSVALEALDEIERIEVTKGKGITWTTILERE